MLVVWEITLVVILPRSDYEITLTIGSDSFIQNNSNSTLLIEDLEVGDLTANNTGLFIDFSNPGSPRDLFDIASNTGEGDWGFQSYLDECRCFFCL